MKTLHFLVLLTVGLVGWSIGRAQQAASDSDWTAPAVIHIPKLGAKDLPKKAGPTLSYKILAATEGATVQMQVGSVGKHYHANANELQYIIEGHGKMWLGDKQVDVGPGDLIIIPKGTAHGMMTDYKAIAVKSPPQAPDDMHKL